ncbi:hypothetical protein NCAS_0G00190 [Naumovozyma castellii]|uniref:Sugar utilization regulatory protein IMP2 n=1 Tax=Naumovozyma castellii TaxID=27288 RepID=G0VHM2_NAUCA|nr:hypothetical protein NCAS_0G00190 [Naumovozyma castellii CBS 4309]CCC70906.1 hypothetical protein NCAS_0G00190 [Naumovozyma castellii CBS 4309]
MSTNHSNSNSKHGKGHKSILLTTPEGKEAPLHHSESNPLPTEDKLLPPQKLEDADNMLTPSKSTDLSPRTSAPSTGVQFDAEQIERGRSRIKKSNAISAGAATMGTSQTGGNIGSLSGSKSRSRSRSRASSRIREEEFLKWTVLRQDPSMRLQNVNENIDRYNRRKKRREERRLLKKTKKEGELEDSDEDDEDDEEEEEEDSDEEEEEESDEEQVSDIENDVEIDEAFNYDLGMKVLPNFCSSINDILDTAKPWIAKYEESIKGKENDNVEIGRLDGGYLRAMQLLTKGKGAYLNTESTATPTPAGRCYILYTDLSSESTYALTYTMGAVINNGDTLYVVHSENSNIFDEPLMLKNVGRIRKHVMHMFDCISAVVDDVDVVALSLTHPYPKHLLNEMIHGLKPVALCVPLSIMLSSLQNFVCSVPTLVIRKKLKRAKRKGITD